MRHKPIYELSEVFRLVARQRFSATKNVERLLVNHGYDAQETIAATLTLIGSGAAKFHKSVELEVVPGTYADIYYLDYLGEQWYVKFT